MKTTTQSRTGLTIEFVQNKLATDTVWLERGILAIYQRQTNAEKSMEATVDHNGIGFSAFDARTLSYQATWIASGRHLTGKHLEKARRMMKKYAKQLIQIAEEKASAAGHDEVMAERITEKAEYARREQEMEEAAYAREYAAEVC